MPLQNRVDPFSAIHAVPQRGMFLGNRGILHDHASQTLSKQTWSTNGWVTCALDYKSWQHPQMGKGTYTSLFFFDEAVALAAGHRPCFLCRRPHANAYAEAAGRALGLNQPPSAGMVNDAIAKDIKPHVRKYGRAPRETVTPSSLPDGAMFAVNETAYLKHKGEAHRWSFDGYGPPEPLPASASRLTPRFSLAALEGGYAPALHESLQTR